MLGKVLGLVTAGVFVGAAAMELLGFFTRDRADGKTDGEPVPPSTTDDDAET